MRRTISVFMALPAAAILFLAACGDGATDANPTEADEVTAITAESDEATAPTELEDTARADASEAEEQAKGQAEDMVDGMVESLEKQQEAEGGGHATFTARDETWEFDAVLCTFGEDEIDEDRAEFTLSSLKDGLQLHLMISSYGHTMSLTDLTDLENPSVSLTTMITGTDDFLVLDGKNVTGETVVYDGSDASLTEIPATVEPDPEQRHQNLRHWVLCRAKAGPTVAEQPHRPWHRSQSTARCGDAAPVPPPDAKHRPAAWPWPACDADGAHRSGQARRSGMRCPRHGRSPQTAAADQAI